MAMDEALALSVWIGLAVLPSGALIGGRVLDAQTGNPVAGAAIVLDGRTAGAAGPDGVFSVPAGPARRVDVLVTAVGYAFVTRRVDVTAAGAELGDVLLNRESGVTELVEVRGGQTARTSTTSSRRSSRLRGPANSRAVCGPGSLSPRPSVCRCSSDC